MAEYSTNYTQNTTDIVLGSETYKFSRVVSAVNPSALDNTCIYCGSNAPVKYDYFPTTRYTGQQLTLMNSKWNVASNKFNFTNSVKDSNFNISFALCDYNSTSENAGINSVYQIGKTIYNETSSSTASNIRILNPTDLRKFLFRPVFDGYLGTSNSLTSNVDIKYLMEHPDNFYVTAIRMKSIFWNGTDYISTSTRLEKIRPCIVGDNYFLPLTTCLARHIFQTTDYNSRKAYTQSFYGAYDEDGMAIDFFPIESNEEISFTQEPSTTNVISDNGNKYYSSYNYYVTDYSLFPPAKQVVKLLAYCGCYFIDSSYSTSGKNLNTFWNDEHIYLGEMTEGARTTGNFIKGTDLLTSNTINKGDFSSQTDFTPGSGGTGDKIDDMNVNPLWAMSSDAGFARYFLMSNDQIGSLQTWLSDTTFPDGYDPYPYIISLIQFPLKLSPDYCMPRTPAGHIVIGGEDTGITASLIANEKAWKGLGTYNVPRENGNFLDYSPYTQYEVYIPCCGWVTCPDIIAGRKIAVKINYDLTTAAIIGNIYVTIDEKEMIVASKSGMMGRETIVSGDAAGVRSAQITSALLSAGTGALNIATGAMSGNAVAAVSGGYHVVAGLAQANIAANSSYARTIGSTGGRALLCQYDKCYLKICTTESDIPATYGHTVGYICNKSGKVSDFRGYTVFDNFDVTGITGLTQRELTEVKRIMESGVYINSPPQ